MSAAQAKSAALAAMDLAKIVRAYLQQAVDEAVGYKALLLDKETMRIVSTLYGRSELAEHGVVHVERIETGAGAEGKEHMELKVGQRGKTCGGIAHCLCAKTEGTPQARSPGT